MGQRVDAAGRLQLSLAARHDGGVLGVDHGAYAQWRQDLKTFEQGAVGGRRQVAEGIAHKGLEAAHPAFKQLLQVGDGVVAQQAMDAVIHIGGFGRLELERQRLQRAGGRVGVGHLEDGGHPAAGGSGRAGLPGLLVRIAWIAEMHMAVDGAGQQVKPVGAHLLPCRRHAVVVTDRHDLLAGNGDAGRDDLLGRDHQAATDDQIDFFGCVCHGNFQSMAQPPSTGRSTPVIWRETSLAKNRQALATSVSVETRRRA